MTFERQRSFPKATTRARSLRRRMTVSEQRLWRALRTLDCNFRRQAPIGPYFADFVAHARRLVIEVDGGIHERLAEVAARDAERQAWLEGEGYVVLRFTNRQVVNDTDACLSVVKEQLALLLDGGGLGGGVSATLGGEHGMAPGPNSAGIVAAAAHTTIPGPSSIEEEGCFR